MNKNFIKEFKELSKEDSLIAGGKGASLGEMTMAGIPVPNGFVILSNAFEFFLEETDINIEINSILGQVDQKKIHTIDNASKKIQSLILKATFPEGIKEEVENSFKKLNTKFVAVRSSATAEDSQSAAWAGQLDSYLNTTKESLFENIKECWASLFTPRAIFYRFEKKLDKQKISVAVVIQKMVESEVSGIAFSVHPVTQDKNQLIIEAGFGLGEAIVSGQITPDSYVVSKTPKKIIDKNVYTQTKGLYRVKEGGNKWQNIKTEEGEKQVLSDKEILELSKLILKIEKHYGFPCDIEWAKEKGKFYIVQSRPITTLKNPTIEKKYSYEFSWGERHSIISTESWLRGYIFLRNIIGNDNKNVFMYVKNGQVNTYNTKEDLPISIESGREVLNHEFLKKHLKNTLTIRKEFKNLYEKLKNKNIQKFSNKQLLLYFKNYQDLFDKTWAFFKVSQPEYLELAKEKLERLIKKRNIENPEEVFITLTTPIEIDLIKEEELASLKLSLKNPNEEKLWQHAQQHPWLFFNTYDKKIIYEFLEKKFIDLQKISNTERENKIKSIENEIEEHRNNYYSLLKKLGNNEDINYLSFVFGTLAVDRLRMKAWWGGAEYLFLPFFQEIAKRANISVEDLFMGYKIKDIIELLKNGNCLNHKIINDRKELYGVAIEDGKIKFYEKTEAQNIFEKIIDFQKNTDNFSDTIKGVVANTGKVKGKVKIIVVEDLKTLITDMDRFKKGDIMVTTMTQPTMVSLARKASAIVTNEGGITSHAAILAREYNIPCIVGTKIATQVLKDGDYVEVDANKGVVRVIERKGEKNNSSVVQNGPITTLVEETGKKEKFEQLKEFEKIRENDLNYFGERVEPYFVSHCIISGMIDKNNLKKIFDWSIGVRWLQVDNYFFQFKRDLEIIEAELKDKLKNKGEKYITSLLKNCKKYGDSLVNISKEISKSKHKSNKELVCAIQQYFLAIKKYSIFQSLALFEGPVMQIAWKIAKKYSNNKDNFEKILELITIPSRNTDSEDEQDNFFKISSRKNKNKLAEKHAKKYGWLSIRFFLGKPWTGEDVLARCKNITPQNAKKQYKKRIAHRKKREILIDKVISRFSKEDINTVKHIREIVYLRTKRAYYLSESAYYIKPLLNQISNALQITYEDLLNLSTPEIVNSLKGNLDYKKHINQRKKRIIIYHNPDRYEVLEGDIAEEYLEHKSYLLRNAIKVNQLVGKIAFKGKIQGIVRIINSNKDVPNFLRGEVLVAAMTTADYTSAMENSIAFITDEGGITCHAAIIAREMKKPCIIGTKIATKVLKDGDLVEVDANKGVVRVIERKGEKNNSSVVQNRPITTLVENEKNFESEKLSLGNQEVDASIITLEMTWKGFRDPYVLKETGMMPPDFNFEIIKGRTLNNFINPNYLKNFSKTCLQVMIDNPSKIKEYKIKTIKTAKEIRKFAIDNFIKIKNYSNKEICDFLMEARRKQEECAKYGVVVACADLFGDASEKAIEILSLRKLKKTLHFYSRALTSSKKSLTEKAIEDIIKRDQREEAIIKKYFWLNQGYIGRGLTKEELMHIKKEKIEKEETFNKKEISKKLKLSEKEYYFFSLLSDMIFIKSLRADSRQFLHVVTNRAVDILSERLNIKSELLEVLTSVEIKDLISGNKDILKKIEERHKHSMIIAKGSDDYNIILGKKLDKFIEDNILKIKEKDKQEIKGQISFQGKVKGIVKIIFGPQHISKVQKGDIMVSIVTSPQLLPAMKKASAFVTDIGGITSHASIVAREMKKPCIVGTEIATQVLKDGDLVEVDANKGVVRIIKKK